MAKERKVTIPGCVQKNLPITEIDEGERFREDLGDLTDLCYSIETHGLINPITVTPKPEGGYLLVAGGRRLAAARHLEMEEVPVRIFPEPLSELDLRILELAENIQRKDMTWQESNALQREIHRLQQEKYGKPSGGGAARSGWSIQDTAEMLGASSSTISDALVLGSKLEAYKDVIGDPGRFKTENDARKAIKVVEETMIRAELSRRQAQASGQASFSQIVANAYRIGDCIEGLKSCPDGSFHFAEVDPPYAIDLDAIKRDNECQGYQELPDSEFILFNRQVLTEVYRVLRDDSFCVYWFAPDPWFEILWKVAMEVGFTGRRMPLVWVKANGQSLNPNSTLANAYEMAFVLRKGRPILAKPGRINVFAFPPVAAAKKRHPTEKPVDLYEEIYETFSFEGAKCVTPFAGSGASILAAHKVKRSSVGWDLTEEFRGGFLQAVNETFMQVGE